MASTRRLKPSIIEADIQAQDAIGEMSGFKPPNEAHKHDALDALKQVMTQKRAAEESILRAADAARDDTVAAEWAYHDAVRAATVSVKAQYGKNSNEVQAVGLKKAEEIRRTGGKTPTGGTT